MYLYVYIYPIQYPITSPLYSLYLHFQASLNFFPFLLLQLSPFLDSGQEREGQAQEALGASAGAQHRVQRDQGRHEALGSKDVPRWAR